MRSLLMATFVVVLCACTTPPPHQVADPQVQAARQACQDMRSMARFTCIEQQAVAAFNPNVCRLLGIAVDDACPQSVYEAANDPAICDRLYLPGAVPTCRNYYASPGRPAPAQPAATSTASQSSEMLSGTELAAGAAAQLAVVVALDGERGERLN